MFSRILELKDNLIPLCKVITVNAGKIMIIIKALLKGFSASVYMTGSNDGNMYC